MQQEVPERMEDHAAQRSAHRATDGDPACGPISTWEAGLVRARMGSQTLAMRVRMEDGSSCFFQGVPRSDDMKGSCTSFTARERVRRAGGMCGERTSAQHQ